MSESLKRLREEKGKPTMDKLRKWQTRNYHTLSGMSQIEELERKAAEARKEEERIKGQEQQVLAEKKRILKELINTIDSLRGDEARDASKYFELAKKYADIPTTSKIFKELSEVEGSHEVKLRQMANELEYLISPTAKYPKHFERYP